MKFALLIASMTGAVCVAAWQPAKHPARPSPVGIRATYGERFAETQRGLGTVGATSCAGPSCHGAAEPRFDSPSLGTEYHLWYDDGMGSHFRAFKLLYGEQSDRMARALAGPSAVAKEQPECLACHAFVVEPSRRSKAVDIENGVTCEACHGRAEKWIGPHQIPAIWRSERTQQQRLADGFYDTRDLVHRAEMCLECHLGTNEKRFSHRILAAGHPPLTFELAGDLFNVPNHWRDEQVFLNADEGSWFHVRVWAVGQAVTLREQMRRLASWATSEEKVDYALFECYACHHDLTGQPWRQRRTPDGELGEPVWDTATWAMCRPLLGLLSLEHRTAMERGIDSIVRSLSVRGGDRARVLRAANEVAEMADRLAEKAAGNQFDRKQTVRILRSIARDRDRISGLGYRSAVQAFSAMYALCRLAITNARDVPEDNDAVLATLVKIEEMLYASDRRERSGEYDAFKFAAMLAELDEQLGG